MSSICRLRARSPKSAIAREVAKAGKHVYTEKPIATTGLEIEALEKTYGVTCTVGHSARLMTGIRVIPRCVADRIGRQGVGASRQMRPVLLGAATRKDHPFLKAAKFQ